MYLLIGRDSDPCLQLVATHLQARGDTVVCATEPLGDGSVFSWMLNTTQSHSVLGGHSERPIRDGDWQGVLVRGTGAPTVSDGWSEADFAYVRAETRAALLGWLHSLPCPVVNRLEAEWWFHPYRPALEWHTLFQCHALPTPAFLTTNDPGTARRFSSRWDGRALYTPLTGAKRYDVSTPDQWAELHKLMEQLPVTLMEPCDGPLYYVTLAGQRLFWSAEPDQSPTERLVFVARLFALAATLHLEFVQVEFTVESDGLRCLRMLVYPMIDKHDPADQEALASVLVSLLSNCGVE